MSNVIDYDHGISAIDSGYVRPMMDAIHLVVEDRRAALVDTGTNFSIPAVLEVLKQKGLGPEAVDWVMLTHVHLDHAGGAGGFMRIFPNARLTVHPRGARHMADPAKLIAGTIEVYGKEEAARRYGDILPVPVERIVETPDGASISLAGRKFDFYDAPGHAKHQVAIRDGKSGHVFAGDNFGLSFREVDWDGHQFIFPTTTPVQFDPPALHKTIDMIAGFNPAHVYVTHYGRLSEIPEKAATLHRQIDALVEAARPLKRAGPDRHRRMTSAVEELVLEEARRYGAPFTPEQVLDVYRQDAELNAQGLEVWLDSNN
ncbi:MAG TPA: MBL fold metallo-hydrolase [Burkholderiales bacterium]|nr:MBL fold metallo-hydrolase [Burkholderiales bacterium]